MPNPQQGLDIVARDFASAVIQKVNGNVENFTQTARKAGSVASVEFEGGLRKASNAVTNLAGDLLGVNNKISNMAEGLITAFGGGGTVVTALGVGIVAIVALYNLIEGAAKKAREETDKLIESQYKLTPQGKREQRMEELQKTNARIAEIQEKLATSNPFREALGLNAAGEDAKALRDELQKLIYTREILMRQGALQLPELEAGSLTADQLRAKKERDARIAQGSDVRGLKVELAQQPVGLKPLGELAGPVDAAVPEFKPAADAALSFRDALGLVAEVAGPVAEAMNAINDSVLGSIPGFGQVAKAAQKAVQIVAKVEGGIAIAKGAVKVAESIWPFNPAGLKSGLGMIAEGTKLSALGGGSGSAGASGGGAGSSASYQPRQEQIAKDQGKVTVVVPRDAVWSTNSTEFQDFLAQTLKNLGGRRLEVTYA